MSRPARSGALAAVGLALLVGCTAPRPVWIAEGQAGGAGVESVLLLPLNVTVALPGEFEPAVDRVDDAIERYLRKSHGLDVAALRPFEARRLWARAAGEVAERGHAEEDRFEAAFALFFAALAESRAFDALVVPSLVYRRATYYQHRATWDGVSRKVVIRHNPQQIGSVHVQTHLEGETRGASLHLLVLDDKGAKIFDSYTGLDLAHEIDVAGGGVRMTGYRWGEVLRVDFLEDPALVQEGVARAFEPLLPRVDTGAN